MTITTDSVVPDDASELFEETLPELDLITGNGENDNPIRIELLDPQCLFPTPRSFNGEEPAFSDDELADLMSSVKVVGFLQPAVVLRLTKDPDTYSLLVGNRRRAVALALGRKLPCIVVESADTAQQILAILFENDHRLGLKPSQRAELYQQLTLVDWKPAMIAKASGHKNAKQVTAALSLVELPPAVKAAADTGQLDLTLAAELSEFADDPKTLAKIIEKGNSTWGFKHAISDARQRKQRDDAADMLFAELTMAGVKITSKPKDFGHSSREASLDSLLDADGGRLDPTQVRTQPGFAAFIEKQAYGGPTAVVYCLDPEKYGYGRVGYSSYVPDAEMRRREQQKAEAEALREALAAAEGVRWEFLKSFYGNAKSAKAHYQQALRAAVSSPSSMEFGSDYADLADAVAGCSIEEHAPTAGIDRLTRILVARWVAADEENLGDIIQGQRYHVDHMAALAYMDRLVAGGYELSEPEASVHAALTPSPESPDDEGEDGTFDASDHMEDPDAGTDEDEQE